MRCKNWDICENYDEIECDDLLIDPEEQQICYKQKKKEYEEYNQ